ncbi:MAG: NAD-dependent epimerase/dehydratase family protein [Candidatus Aenigmatarchaeota archaeon]
MHMKILITGGAGFIGSHLVDKFIRMKSEVIVLDNLSTGNIEFIQEHLNKPNFKFYKVDLLDRIEDYFRDVDEVWHLAANPNVRIIDPKIHFEQNILATKSVLEAMRKNDVKKIFFTSSSTVYGEAISSIKSVPIKEDSPTNPISLYGASKLASEALIQAYCHVYDFQAWIFRLANIVGPRLTHGVIFDFINKLRKNPNKLEILGDGNQKKSYLFIEDCIRGMMILRRKGKERVNIFNIGNEDWISVKSIAKIICKKLNLRPKFKFTGGDRGWKGDVPLMILDISKAKKFGFKPKYDSEKAVIKAVKGMIKNEK